MNKIGILGAAGDVGRYALEYLNSTGRFQIEAVSRNINKARKDLFFNGMINVSFTEADITDNAFLEEFVRRNDVVLNMVSGAVRKGSEIADICAVNNRPFVDAGTGDHFKNVSGKGFYTAGALPGLSVPLAFYAARNFSKVTNYRHITSMSGVFSFGAAYDYLEGVTGSTAKSGMVKQLKGVNVPFIGEEDLTEYSDLETAFLKKNLCADGESFVSFGGAETGSIMKQAAVTFSTDKTGSANKLVELSRLHHIRANDHFMFLIEISGISEEKEKTSTLVLRMESSQSLTGLVSGICTEMAADETDLSGLISFSEFSRTPFFNRYMPDIVKKISGNKRTVMFDEYGMSIDELNEESYGEI